MISSNDVINLIKGFSLAERLKIVEDILRNIREENMEHQVNDYPKGDNSGPAILNLSGIITEEEASVLNGAVEESRKIDQDEW